jgi:CDP-6-deoxy-D-xylo-4-hexulose-3-dehydrase
MLEGGICVTGDVELAEMMRILRAHGWIRELEAPQRYIDAHPQIDPRFLFVNTGYNLRLTELQGAIGLVQLPKLAGFVETRRANALAWRDELGRWGEFLDLQQETPDSRSSWFGLPLTVRDGAPFSRHDIREFLEQAHIETRPIIAGNIARQPGLRRYPHRVVGDLAQSSRVMDRGFAIGNHQNIDEAARRYAGDQIAKFMARHGSSR